MIVRVTPASADSGQGFMLKKARLKLCVNVEQTEEGASIG
jgi:hypothetical protein